MKRSNFLRSMILLPFLSLKAIKRPNKNNVTYFTPEMLSRNNYGLFIINVKADVEKNPGYAATVSWKLCWQITTRTMPKYGKVNFLTDGWVYPIAETEQGVCDYLNHNPHGEQFRLMTKEEVAYLIINRNQGFLQ